MYICVGFGIDIVRSNLVDAITNMMSVEDKVDFHFSIILEVYFLAIVRS